MNLCRDSLLVAFYYHLMIDLVIINFDYLNSLMMMISFIIFDFLIVGFFTFSYLLIIDI